MNKLLPTAVLLTTALTQAQVPDGHYVVSSNWTSALGRGPGGLFLVDPRVPGAPIVVQALGADLLGHAAHGGVGASAVAIRSDDGALLVGEIGTSGNTIDLHEIVLNGAAVASDRRIPVGIAGIGSHPGIAEIALLPNGDALIAVRELQNAAPLHGALLAIVSRSGVVTPVPTPILRAEYPLALAVDPEGTTAYVVVAPAEPHAVHLYSVPLPAGGSAQLIGTFVPTLTGLTFGPDGDLVACSTTDLFLVDVPTGTLFALSTLPGGAVSIAAELATADFALVQNGFGPGATTGCHHVGSIGPSTLLTSAISGVLTDVAVLPNPRTYGAATAGGVAYDWEVTPAPGGLPRVGNAGFAIQVIAQGGPLTPGFVFATAAPAQLPLFGVDVLLDPSMLVPLGATSTAGAYALPVPPSAPVGAAVFVQSFHLDPGAPLGVAATPGQRFRVMP